MRIIFCNTAYLKYFDGRIAGELKPTSGGRWVKENEDAHEKWNFLNIDGKCYGYVQGGSDIMHLERLEGVSATNATAEDVTSVWCALKGNETVIVGWYEHATAYREIQESFITPVSGIDRYYWFETNAENAYLMPESKRTFRINRASQTGMGTGFGQNNYWFADSEFAKSNIVPIVMDYIEENRKYRINTLPSAFIDNSDSTFLSNNEKEFVASLDENDYSEYVKYGYRVFAEYQNGDTAYDQAVALEECYQYSLAIEWYNKSLELPWDDELTESERLYTMSRVAYLYQQCGDYQQSTITGERIMNSFNITDEQRMELFAMFADNCMLQLKIKEGIAWLERIIADSHDEELIKHTKAVKENWKSLQ